MSGLVKKCCYCRKELEDSTETGVPPSVHCDRCKKNEAKYGKPGICKYCQLPAAFHDEKCVYCSFSERRNGEPLPCANCQLRAYFDHTGRKKPGLCRMCINLAHARKEKTFAGVKVPPYEIPPSRKDKSKKRKSTHDAPQTSSTSANKMPRPMDSGEHVLQLQQLKDKIQQQAETIRQRDEQLIAKDKEIATLKAERSQEERRQREKYERMKKDHDNAIVAIHEKYKADRIAQKTIEKAKENKEKEEKRQKKEAKEKEKGKEKEKERKEEKEKDKQEEVSKEINEFIKKENDEIKEEIKV